MFLCPSRNRWRSRTSASVNLVRYAKPRPQFRFQDLASRVARQRVYDLQRLRMLIPREPFAEELVKITEVNGSVGDGAKGDDGDGDFAPPLVSAPDHRHLDDGGMTGQNV